MEQANDRVAALELGVIADMTEAMLTAANESRWPEVQRIDLARSELLKNVPAATFTAGDEAVRRVLREALAATRSIEARIAAERDRLARELRTLNHRQAAASAYGNCAAMRP